MFLPLPFCSKELADGKKLYRRKHGYSLSCPANTNSDLIVSVPYDAAKINEIEIINLPIGTKIDFSILDTPSGTISGQPNYLLNQFGFDVRAADSFYKDHSPYDADVIRDLQLKVTVKNETSDAFDCYVNIVFHEVK